MSIKTKEIIDQLDSILQVTLLEQEDEDKKKSPPPEEITSTGTSPETQPEKTTPTETPPVGDETMNTQVPGGDEMGGMAGMGMGMGEEDPNQFDMTTLGRVYELRKIYARLVSIESHLSDSSDINLLRVRNYTLQAIELFEMIAANLKKFETKLPDIIVLFYKFIDRIYAVVVKYYKEKQEKDDKKDKRSPTF